jgi:ParB/RepB/Spo0J family partition protein
MSKTKKPAPKSPALAAPTSPGQDVAVQEKTLVADELVTEAEYRRILLSQMRNSPDNRKRFDEAALNELGASIKAMGVVQPILVRPVTPTAERPEIYEIVAGERRYRGSIIAGLLDIPAMVRVLTDLEAAKIRILENLQRVDPHPMEEAEGYQLLMLQHGYNADQLADEIKKSRAYVYGRLKLCALTTEVREEFLYDKVSASTALLIARIPVPALQIKALNEIQRPYGGMTADPLSHRAAALHIQQRYMLDLTNAIFKITDAKLLPSAGPCTTCPKRTGNQPEIFQGISADVCTDPDCFGEKKAAHHAATVTMANKKGIPVLEGAERLTVIQSQWTPGNEFVHGAEALHRFERNAPATKNSGTALSHLGADGLPPVALLTKGDDGEVVTWYKRTAMQAALEAAGVCETVEQHAERMTAWKANAAPAQLKTKSAEEIEWEQRDIIAEQETQFRVGLYKKLRSVGEGSGFSLESLREFTKLAVRNMPLPDDLLGDVYDFDASTDEKVFAYVDQAGLPAIQLLLIDLVVGESLAVTRHDIVRGTVRMPNNDFDAVIAMAKHQGIDPDVVREELLPTPINVDDATAASLASFIAKYPHRLDELAGVVLPHPRGELTGMLERAAKDAGYVYVRGVFEKLPPLLVGVDLSAPAVDICPSLSVTTVDQGGADTAGDEFLEAMMEAPAPAPKKQSKGKAAKDKTVLEPAAAWPFPKTSDGVRAATPAAPADPTPQDTETAQEIPA